MRQSFLKRNDIDFTRDDIHRFLPWLIAVMACLTTLLLCLTISIHSWIDERHHSFAANFTVNIPARITEAEKIQHITEMITSAEGVESVMRIKHAQLQEALQEWLGSSDIKNLPFPTVLEVYLDEDMTGTFNHAALQTRLEGHTPGIEVDAHETWVRAFASFSNVISFILITLSLIIITAMGTAIIFTSRTALRLHSKTVALLHSVGAEDMYITRQFQQDALITSLPGLVGGTVFAALLYWASGAYAASLPATVLPSLTIQTGHIVLFFILPLFCAGAASVVARVAVLKQLRRTL